MRTPEQIAATLYPGYMSESGIREAAIKGAREAQRDDGPQFAPGEEFDYYRDEYYDLLNWGEPIDPESPFGRVRLTSQVGETKNLTVTTGQSYHILAYLSEQNRPLKEQEETEQL